MNKKFLGVLILFLLSIMLNQVSAIGNLSFVEVTNVTVNPSTSITTNFTINNTGDPAISSITATSTNLIDSSGNSITAPTITAISNLAANTSTLKSFTITVPATPTGTYVGDITAVDASNPSGNNDTIQYQVFVSSLASLSVTTYTSSNPLILSEEAGTSVSKSFTITNDGSETLSSISAGIDFSLSDNDGDNITLAFSSVPSSLTPGSSDDITVTATIPSRQDLGVYEGNLIVNDTSSPEANVSFAFEIRVQPELCEDGEVGNLDIEVTEPDTGDNFNPGDTISIEVDVDNDYTDDLEIVVEAFLYNIDEDDEIERIESSSIEIADGDSEEFNLKIKIPTKDIDEDDEYILYVKAYEEGDEDDHCAEDSVEIDIEREKHSVIVDQITFTPSTTKCGDTVEVKVDVDNIGTNDEDDVTVRILETTLGIDQTSTTFDLDKYGKSKDEQTIRFSITIPDDATVGSHDIEAIVTFDDGDETSSEFKTLTISSCGEVVITTAVSEDITLTLHEKTIKAKPGKLSSIPIKITNTGKETKSYETELSNIEEFAEPSQSKTLTLAPAQSSTVYLSLRPKQDVETGKYSATVNVKSGGVVIATETVTIEIEGKAIKVPSKIGEWFSGTKALWILGDIILIVVVIFFIKMIFGGKKPEMTEITP